MKFCKEKGKLVFSQPASQCNYCCDELEIVKYHKEIAARFANKMISLTSNISAILLTGKFHSSWHTRRKLFMGTNRAKNVDPSYPFHVDPGICRQPVLMKLQPPGDSPDGGRGGQDPRPLDRAKPGNVLSTPDSIQEANEEQVGGQLLDAAEHQGPALGAPELLLGFQDPLQTGLAESVLAR